ncbi:threonine ammonia-lyase [Elstera cyanobacteriorum]|uniref:threonine ammonia-lyase n=1 Tax=Elstera cyanobacteriorum TaxID=2022747 RepID=UPI002357B0DB|nr:pyridoxal-phosphate dependent enzyme [Elstera cyanobacteriorum]MCK6443828.1 pyridoxal-phosphate dependent enzyme [Elstera cyanobacteriorum]
MSAIPPPSIFGICAAHHAINPVFRNSPFYGHPSADAVLSCSLRVKVETQNPIRAAEGRGADWFFSGQPQRTDPLVTASPGNFGQGLAYAARDKKRPLIIFAPVGVNPAKLEAMRHLGADVRLEGADLYTAKEAARAYADTIGGQLLDDGAHPRVVEGFGTIAREMTEAGVEFDTVLLPLGAGALAIGVGLWLRAEKPNVRVIGLVPETSPAMLLSWQAGKVVTAPPAEVPTIADGLAQRAPSAYAFAYLRQTIDDVWSVRDGAILAGMRFCHQHYGLIIEPAGAIGVGAILERPEAFAGQRVATVLCGGNMTPDQIRTYLG